MSDRRQANIPRLVILPLLLGLSACATDGHRDPATMEAIQGAIDEGITTEQTPPPTPPEAVSSALLPPVQINVPGADAAAAEPRFDVKVRRAQARDFFLSLVEGTPYNIVVHPEVGGRISLDLKNVSVQETLDIVRTTYGYDYERTPAGFQILPNTMRTKLYFVDYLDIQRRGNSTTLASSGQVSMSSNNGSEGNSGSGDSSSSVGSVINTQSESNFWSSLAESLRLLVGSEDGRKVTVNAQSGVIMVRAMPAELRDVEAYLQATQAVAQRQVVLEARILEVELNDAFQSGINWASLSQSEGDTLVLGQVGGGSLFSGSGQSTIAGNSGVLSPLSSSAIEGTASSAFGGMFTMAFSGKNFNAFIEMLKGQGDVQVLSSPRVSTVNNQKAVIKVGSDEFFVTDVDTNTTTGTATTSNVSVELTPFFSGVTLDVIPQISREGDIILHIHPAVSEVDEQVKSIISTVGTMSVPLAASTIRESDSVIRARNGQIVVIGGLMQNSTREEQTSVPLLGDIPLLGYLFRHTREVKRKSELVILLKPTVVEGDQQWSQQLRQSSERFKQMGANPPPM